MNPAGSQTKTVAPDWDMRTLHYILRRIAPVAFALPLLCCRSDVERLTPALLPPPDETAMAEVVLTSHASFPSVIRYSIIPVRPHEGYDYFGASGYAKADHTFSQIVGRTTIPGYMQSDTASVLITVFTDGSSAAKTVTVVMQFKNATEAPIVNHQTIDLTAYP
jgi:hypothetical protein